MMETRGFLVLFLVVVLQYTICAALFDNRGDIGARGIAGFGTRSGYRGAGRWWCTCRSWGCHPWERQVQSHCSFPFDPWWWRTCCQWLPWWKTTSGFGGSGSISGFGGSGFQNRGKGGDGFDSIRGARGIAGFGVRGRSRPGGKNY